MLSVFWIFTFSLSIFIAGIIAIIRFTEINNAYNPFLFCIWFACINELFSFILFRIHYSSEIHINIYVLFESLLIITLFKKLKYLNRPKYLYHAILTSLIFVWFLENFVFGKITTTGIYFSLYYSFIIVLISISSINILIASARKFLIKNSIFLLCLGFILYFTYKVLVYSFWMYGLNSKEGFLLKIFTIMSFINLIANLIYALAVLWMPRKIEYTQPY